MDEAPKEYPDDPETQEWMNAPMGRMKSALENQPELTDFLAALQTWTTQHWKNLPRDAREDWGRIVAGLYAALQGVSFDPPVASERELADAEPPFRDSGTTGPAVASATFPGDVQVSGSVTPDAIPARTGALESKE